MLSSRVSGFRGFFPVYRPGHGPQTSTRENPSKPRAWAMRSARPPSYTEQRATKGAPAAAAVEHRSRGFSSRFRKPEETAAPGGVVHENWPPVMPKLKLLRTKRLRSRLRLQASRK